MSFKTDKYNDVLDENLIQLILKGNKEALNSLINRHKDWVYNVALRMTGNHHESDDVTQEILIKIVTKLSTFKFNSSFKTWLYRITVNHVLSMRKMGKEGYFSSFEKHEKFFENLPNEELGDKYSIDKKMLIEETKVECMLGMLLCLDREQRIVFILGG
ncbi:MAG: RNA polymerase sigma factor, partial [bacterium]|nr:RNA polymerase sigma factor [bacterium]